LRCCRGERGSGERRINAPNRLRGLGQAACFEGELREALVADEIIALADRDGADLIVAGAYWDGRTPEWAFGGVTRELLNHAPIACLPAH